MAFAQTSTTGLTSREFGYSADPFVISVPAGAVGELIWSLVHFSVGAQRNYAVPSGWREVAKTFANSSFESYLYARVATGVDDSLTINKGGAAAAGVAITHRMAVIPGKTYNVNADIDGVFFNSFATPNDPPGLPAPWGTTLDSTWFTGVVSADSTTVSSYPAGYTQNQVSVAEGGVTSRLSAASRELNAASENPGEFSFTGTHTFGQLVTLVIAGTAPSGGGTNGSANGVTVSAAASLIAGAASGSAGTLAFQSPGLEFGRRTGLALSTFALEAGVSYRYTVHADGLVLGAPIFTSGVVATDSSGRLPNASNAAFITGQTVWVCAVRQADGQRAIFPMVVA